MCSYNSVNDAKSRERYADPGSIPTHELNISAGVLVECDPSIKAIILKIDQDKHDYIVEDLDDQTLVVKESQLQKLKARLEEVMMIKLLDVYLLVLRMLARSWRTRSNNQTTRARIDEQSERITCGWKLVVGAFHSQLEVY